MMKTLIKIFLLAVFCLFPLKFSISQETTNPTTVFGEAQTSNGNKKLFILQQPNNDINPLGNPILFTKEKGYDINVDANKPITMDSLKNNSLDNNNWKNKVVSPSEAELLGKKFQNTLMEANGMVYDIQSYPIKDLEVIGNPANPETIYSPNVNP